MKADLTIVVDFNVVVGGASNLVDFLDDVLDTIVLSPNETRVSLYIANYDTIWSTNIPFSFEKTTFIEKVETLLSYTSNSDVYTPSTDVAEILKAVFDDLQTNNERLAHKDVHSALLVLLYSDIADKQKFNEIVKTIVDNNGVVTSIIDPYVFGNSLKDDEVSLDDRNVVFQQIRSLSESEHDNILAKICREPQIDRKLVYDCFDQTEVVFLLDESSQVSLTDSINFIDATRKIIGSFSSTAFTNNRLSVEVMKFAKNYRTIVRADEHSTQLQQFLVEDSVSPTSSSFEVSNLVEIIQNILSNKPADKNVFMNVFLASNIAEDAIQKVSTLSEDHSVVITLVKVGDDLNSDENISNTSKVIIYNAGGSQHLRSNTFQKFISNVLCTGVTPVFSTPVSTPKTTTSAKPVSTPVTDEPTSSTHLPTTSEKISTTTAVPTCVQPMDIATIIDAKIADNEELLNEVSNLLLDTFYNFQIDKYTTRVTTLIVGDVAERTLSLSGNGADKQSVLEKISSPSLTSAMNKVSTESPYNISSALEDAVNFGFIRNPRATTYTKNILLVLNSQPIEYHNDELHKVFERIEALQRRGINTILIVLDSFYDTLSLEEQDQYKKAFGSSLLTKSLFENDNEDGVLALSEELVDMLCYPQPTISTSYVSKSSTSKGTSKATSTPAATTDYTSTTTSGYSSTTIIPPITQTTVEECKRDIIFLLDGSSSIATEEWQLLQNFVKNITKLNDVGNDNFRVSQNQLNYTKI